MVLVDLPSITPSSSPQVYNLPSVVIAEAQGIPEVCSCTEMKLIFVKSVEMELLTLTQLFLSIVEKSPHCFFELSPRV